MKKISTILALAAGALLAGQESPTPVQQQSAGAKAAEPVTAGQRAGQNKPQPTKPATSSAHQQRVYVRTQPILPDYRPVYAHAPRPRRVRYGKCRWIILA